jgi:hypothetical protein
MEYKAANKKNEIEGIKKKGRATARRKTRKETKPKSIK